MAARGAFVGVARRASVRSLVGTAARAVAASRVAPARWEAGARAVGRVLRQPCAPWALRSAAREAPSGEIRSPGAPRRARGSRRPIRRRLEVARGVRRVRVWVECRASRRAEAGARASASLTPGRAHRTEVRRVVAGYLVDPASSHMLVSKIKPCMSKYKRLVL